MASESNFPPDFSRVTEAIWKACHLGLMTATEARENMRRAGMVLGDDRVIDPEPIHLPELVDDPGDYDEPDDGDAGIDEDDFEEAAS